MGIWIRSQDREYLINAKIFWIEETKICCLTEDTVYPLGKYETEERALEVLDQIQEQVQFKELVNCVGLSAAVSKVEKTKGNFIFKPTYEMPEK